MKDGKGKERGQLTNDKGDDNQGKLASDNEGSNGDKRGAPDTVADCTLPAVSDG